MVAFALSFRQRRKLVTAATMNVTIVEADDAMSVFSSVSGEGVVGWYWEADEDGTGGALPDKACDALFNCTTVTCGSWIADM
ncbi:hypothetical protein DLM46_37800 [Paraburkholderia lacunae]|uniref:Uncharacterized protein n=2 Tax=Paraburkholderia lacunae TaxID=2211104 RepID=A0A370MVJ5_9BURK|nr:hypothetical protein DLM46_37800 [Paraburkholderia lacunae]